ncbi:hypothetical protein MJO29_003807 [Puccinia striiformis f. sp. tritici]|nr:hypothetical protein MJO29_003807 [Puccinia striiformis f. sp. tritici]
MATACSAATLPGFAPGHMQLARLTSDVALPKLRRARLTSDVALPKQCHSTKHVMMKQFQVLRNVARKNMVSHQCEPQRLIYP